MKKRKAMPTLAGCAICALLVLMSSCSKQNPGSKSTTAGGKKDSVSPSTTSFAPPQYKVSGVHYLGETFQVAGVVNGELTPDAMTYTITKATVFSDAAEAGISQDAMTPYVESLFKDADGKIKAGVKLLIVELTVKNSRLSPQMNIGNLELCYSDTANSSSEKAFHTLPIPSYFSNPTGTKVGNDWQGYLDYNLPVGQSKNLKTGWYVDLSKYDKSTLYLIFNSGYEKYRQFVKLFQ